MTPTLFLLWRPASGAAAALALLLLAPSAGAGPRANSDVSRRAHGAVASIEHAGARVQSALRTARTRGDDAASACLSRKLNQVHAQARLAEDRARHVEAGVDGEDRARALRELRVLELYAAHAARLSRESLRCDGVSHVSTTTTLTVIRPALPLQTDTSLASLFRP